MGIEMTESVLEYQTCPECGAILPIRRSGRKKLDIPVKIIYDALKVHQDIAQAAEYLNCSRGYIYQVLKEVKTTPKEVMGK